ncbi:MAG: RNA-guided endonuclease TnpB family protein, partial [Methanomassiliicoccaceae archaeon]|nr:RNA-guided endonuclease TnpB family protein [Methanomassiliicoccaceae archaeon]
YGKQCLHIHEKYSHLRRTAQREGSKKRRHKYRKAKIYKQREKHIIKNINHHISKAIVANAKEQKAKIALEDLSFIRDTAKTYGRLQRHQLNSWAFCQLERMIDYKAQLQGVPVEYVDPYNTSKLCSRCGNIGIRDGKLFKCPHCGHADHADVNAGFNIALRSNGRLSIDRDMLKGYTDKPEGGTIYIEELLFGRVH